MNMINHERVLIGSSNVANFYKKSDFSEYPDYRMIKSTRFETFKAQMLKLERSNKLVVISVIENCQMRQGKEKQKMSKTTRSTLTRLSLQQSKNS